MDAIRALSDLSAERPGVRSEEHTSELQSQSNLVCRLLLEKKNKSSSRISREARFKQTTYSNDYTFSCSTFTHVISTEFSTYCFCFFTRRLFFFFNDTATTEIYTLSLHDALPIWAAPSWPTCWRTRATRSSPRCPR